MPERLIEFKDIAAKIERCAINGGGMREDVAQEFAFHMTDWLGDLNTLIELFAAEKWNDAEAFEALLAFVVHVAAHLAAGHVIAVHQPLTDVFMLGAVAGDGKPRRDPGQPFPEDDAGRSDWP